MLPAAALSLESWVAFKVPFACLDGKNKLVAGAVQGLGLVKAGEVCGAASPCRCTSPGQGRLEEQHAQVPALAAGLWVLSTPASTGSQQS